MFKYLQLSDPRDRRLVAVADALLAPAGVARLRARGPAVRPRRILLLRLERIGDLLMVRGALAAVRALAPDAEIDLVTGSWNAPIARMIPGVSRLESLDAAWLAREGTGLGLMALMRRALGWRARRYDLAINFEPDIRSHLLLALSGARRRAGFVGGGGGALLTRALDYDPRAHTAANAVRLVEHAFGAPAPRAEPPPLRLPDAARREAAALLGALAARAAGPLVGVHPCGGRPIKQWDADRFGDVAARLARERHATIVLTGADADRPIADAVRAALPPGAPLVDLVGRADLERLAAVLARLDLLVTGDTGPMHLASAVGTPVVAIFGPSDPARYAPLGSPARIVRIDLACSPCNRIRRPPERCVGHTPDCLRGVEAAAVFDAAAALLDEGGRAGAAAAARS
jgi:lipopolysaccharide heptosyltransferase II